MISVRVYLITMFSPKHRTIGVKLLYRLFLSTAASVVMQTVFMYRGALKAAKCVHNRLLNSIFHWPSVTFDRVPMVGL